MTCVNRADPLLLPWTNITVSSDSIAENRGIRITIGFPPQTLSVRPDWASDNLWLPHMSQCRSMFDDSCLGPLGGAYDPNVSSGYQLATTFWNGTQGLETQNVPSDTFSLANDVLWVDGDSAAYGYPFILSETGNFQGLLPLGWNSTFLAAAVDIGAAPARSWGMWTGSRSISEPVEGLLVIGGYDSARIERQLTEFPSLDECPGCLQLENLTYIDENGISTSLTEGFGAFQVGLQPYTRTIEIPQQTWDVFVRASNGTYDPILGSLTWPTTNRPNGNLSVQVRTGKDWSYTIEMPSKELFSLPRTYDETGRYSINDDSVVISTVVNYTNTDPEFNYLPNWGLPFLTMNYLVMDMENERFFMAPAKQGLLPDGEGTRIQPLCTGLATPGPTAAETSSGIHTGAIVGGVLGGIGGLVIVAIALFILGKRRASRRQAKLKAERENETLSGKPELPVEEIKKLVGFGNRAVAEIGSQARAELPADNKHPHEAIAPEPSGNTEKEGKRTSLHELPSG